MDKSENLVWLDLEMTGLDPEIDRIIEIATIVTDKNLNELAVGPVFAIHQSEVTMANMNAWCMKIHNQNGLAERVKKSTINESEAEQQTIEFLEQYINAGQSPLCGNSISQDRRFLYKYMPALQELLHYRNIDVSSIKELAKRWKPDLQNMKKQKSIHLALDDIRNSVNELRFYREHFIKI